MARSRLGIVLAVSLMLPTAVDSPNLGPRALREAVVVSIKGQGGAVVQGVVNVSPATRVNP
jgi:hypothetical protein